MKLSRLDPRQWSLQVKFPLTVAGIIFSVAFAAGVVAQVRETNLVREALEKRARQLGSTLALSSAENVVRTDYWALYAGLRRHVDALDHDMAPLLFGAIVNDQGSVLSHTHPDQQRIGVLLVGLRSFDGMYPSQGAVIRNGAFRGSDALLVSTPIEYRGKEIGYVWLGYDTSFIRQRVLVAIVQIGAIATLLAVAGSLFGWMYSRRTVRPIGELTDAIEQIRAGRFDEIAPVRAHEKDEIGRMVDAFNDMAAQLREREALREQLQVNEKLAAIGRMVSGIAHEINNPLGGMKNALENLRLFSGDPQRREESVQLLGSGLEQLGGVVEALLAQHRGARTLVPCDPRCLDDLFLLVRHDCELRRIRIEWKNELVSPFLVPRAPLQQVLTNLLVNAVRAMPGGGTLTFRATERDDTLVFIVEDTGVGMAQDELNKIFEPFFTTRADGTGLGLWVSMRLVHAMGGVLEVASEVGAGSCFSVTIPKVPLESERSNEDELVSH